MTRSSRHWLSVLLNGGCQCVGSAPFVPSVVVRADPVSAAVSAALPASLVGIRVVLHPLCRKGLRAMVVPGFSAKNGFGGCLMVHQLC